jgi:hypothetical protein
VDQMTREDADVQEYVRALEERQSDEVDLAQISGESIAREFERYLRRRRQSGPGSGPGPGPGGL